MSNGSGNLPIVWTYGIKSLKEKADLEVSIRNSQLLQKLRKILESRLAELDSGEESDSFWLESNVSERLAFNRGQRRELKDTLRLLPQ